MYLLQYDDNITHGDVAMILSVGGLAQGISFFLGKGSLICLFIWNNEKQLKED